jgi:phosphoesterase RecJ-like protein
MLAPDSHALFREVVDGARRFVLTTHVNPDGDAIGSLLGLSRFLRAAGRNIRVVAHDPTPGNLRFLEEADLRVEAYDAPQHGPLLRDADHVLLLDNSAPDRLGRMETPMAAVAAKTLCIDHHPTRGTPWARNILDPQACATAAMIYALLESYGWEPDPRTAEALYVGVATDTGFFRFNSTTRDAHEIAARLLGLGVDPARCYREIHERNSEAYTRLLGLALAGLRVDAGGSVVSVRLTREMIDRCRAHDVDTSEMTTPLLSMDGVWVALLFRELSRGRVKVSLRSKGDVDVHQLASEFGGGGHRNASGIVMEGELDEVLREVTARAAALVGVRPRG